MLQLLQRNQEAFLRLREAVINQETAVVEQRRMTALQSKPILPTSAPEDGGMVMYPDEYKETGGFAGADPKKRRGVGSLSRALLYSGHLLTLFL